MNASPPPQSTVMQMMMAAWTAQTIAAVARLGIADILQREGPLTARELVERHGVDTKPAMIERALRACASVGIFAEAKDGRFGPTPLSAVLVDEAPGSVRSFVELIGGPWWSLFGGLSDTLRTGEPRRPATTPFQDDPERFAKAMRSRTESTRGAVEHTGPLRTTFAAGSIFVVPRGLWHRQNAAARTTLLFATALKGSEHSWAEDPRAP
jgi:hypothetical protein